jgi:hypothetical protein
VPRDARLVRRWRSTSVGSVWGRCLGRRATDRACFCVAAVLSNGAVVFRRRGRSRSPRLPARLAHRAKSPRKSWLDASKPMDYINRCESLGPAHGREAYRFPSECPRRVVSFWRPSLLEPGQIFASRYRVRRCIAEGGMGAIFEAEHTATERRVALKLLFPHIMSVGNALEKFELEAKISARVNSPYIVEVLDAGFDATTKSPFLVMELLDGQTLARRIAEQGPLPVEAALRLLEQVAAGLDAAHGYREPSGLAKPIVHRDLKPENLFLARQHDGSIVAKILDYGIAKVLGDTSNVSQEVRGTPLFMAFEQITAGALSPQTDVWAYGLIAYHMLTGARYWRSSERQGASVQALFAEILSLPLEAPSVRLREQNVGIELPAAFDAWLLRCIDRDPSRRFGSAGAAADALGQVFERSSRRGSKLAPERLLGAGRTQTFVSADAAAAALRAANASAALAGDGRGVLTTDPSAQVSSAGSVPAMATTKHRRSFPAGTPASKPAHWLAAGAAGGALLLGLVVWLSSGDVEPSAAPAARIPGPVISVTPTTADSTAGSAPSRANGEVSGGKPAARPGATGASLQRSDHAVPLPSPLPLREAHEPAFGNAPTSGDAPTSGPAPASTNSAESSGAHAPATASPSRRPRVQIAPLEGPATLPARSRIARERAASSAPSAAPGPSRARAENEAPPASPTASTTPRASREPNAASPDASPRTPKPKASRKPRPGSSEAYKYR